MEENIESSLFDLKIDEECKDQLRGLTTWAKIIVITSLVSLIFGLIRVIMPGKTAEYSGYKFEDEKSSNLAGYILTVIISLLLAYFLYQFSVFTKKGVDSVSQPDMNKGLGNLKAYFMTYGIIVIVCLVIVFLLLLFVGVSKIE